MKNKKSPIAYIVFYLIFNTTSLVVSAQQTNVKRDLDYLTSQTSFVIQYDYSELAVGKFDSDHEYVAYKMTGYNEDEESEKNIWLSAWYGNREKLYHPSFEEKFNSTLKKTGISVSDDSTSYSHLMVVKTLYIEPGFYVGVMTATSEVKLEIKIFDKSNLKLPLSRFVLKTEASDYEAGSRIAKAYGKSGKYLAKIFIKGLNRSR